MEVKDGIEGLSVFIALHRNQLEASGVPQHYWETLYLKLKNTVFDGGLHFGLVRLECEDEDDIVDPLLKWKVLVTDPNGIKAADNEHIYLVDHAWTFRPAKAKEQLNTIPGLLERMVGLMDIDSEELTREEAADSVLERMWKYSQSYSIANPEAEAEERVPVWYILDEFGSRIQHSDEPSVRVVPFFFMTEQAAYSLLFPVKDLSENDEVTRDFVEGSYSDKATLAALLYPWSNQFSEEVEKDISYVQEEPGVEYFTSGRHNESLPDLSVSFPSLPTDRKIKAYVEYRFIRDFLKNPRFEVVDNPDDADVLWLSKHYKEFKELSQNSPHKRINQFPCEHVLTVKDLLCVVARRAHSGPSVNPETLETYPSWLPTTYNLKTEVPKFLAYYKARQEKELDNHWIVKPWNLARSLDTHITSNIDFILRLAVSGPKVVQKYIERPVLFHREDLSARVKFDIRYIILLESVQPLSVFAYKRFWLRFANQPFDLSDFDQYEKHFTVMNYTPTNLHQMFCHDFIRQFEEQYPDHPWSQVEPKIFQMLRGVFEGAAGGEPPTSVGHNPQSRAMYAVDLMLQWNDDGSMQPKILEINWAPDCKRACEYYPEFFDDVFSVLFLGESEGKHVERL